MSDVPIDSVAIVSGVLVDAVPIEADASRALSEHETCTIVSPRSMQIHADGGLDRQFTSVPGRAFGGAITSTMRDFYHARVKLQVLA